MAAINISFSEGSNKIVIEEGAFNKQTSLTLVGKNASNYGVPFAENFLHLLENFSSRIPPINPITGQLWFDNTPSVKSLKVYSGTAWMPAGSVKKSTSAPDEVSSIAGDLWVNPGTRQLFMYSGTQWDLIGPQFSSGTQTGPMVETIRDIYDDDHSVLVIYANGIRVGIIAAESFTPKIFILGFSIVKKGFNLSTNNVVGEENKLWGIADSASALMCNEEYVLSTNFLRGDVVSTSFSSLNIKDNDGITVGGELAFKISTASDNSVYLTSKKNTPILFNFYNSNSNEIDSSNIGMYISPDFKVGIGLNNVSPEESLDVIGNSVLRGTVSITDISPADAQVSASLLTSGGISVGAGSYFASTSVFKDTVTLGKLDGGAVLVPDYSDNEFEAEDLSINWQTYTSIDIGSETRKFRNVYADNFNGSFTGTFDGVLSGSVIGSATSLKNERTFSLTGDITCEPVPFNGTGPVVMTTSISSNFISSKTKATSSLDTDQILTFRASTGVQRTTKELFLQSVPAVPIGAIFPFAGVTVPNGYLLCDGSEVPVAQYGELFAVIRYYYRTQATLIGAGTFALPDLRGRFPLGRDDMDNDITVVTPSGIPAHAGGNRNGPGTQSIDAAGRVHNVSAKTIGGSAGAEALGLSAATGASGFSTTMSSSGQITSILNPYQTINYIIFTGVIS